MYQLGVSAVHHKCREKMMCLSVDGGEICHGDNKAAPFPMSPLYISRWMSHKYAWLDLSLLLSVLDVS